MRTINTLLYTVLITILKQRYAASLYTIQYCIVYANLTSVLIKRRFFVNVNKETIEKC